VGRRKKIRNDRQSGPLRFSDHIRDWFLDGKKLKSDLEVEFVEAYFKTKYWPPLIERIMFRDGEELPEITTALFAMKGYDELAEYERSRKQSGGGGR